MVKMIHSTKLTGINLIKCLALLCHVQSKAAAASALRPLPAATCLTVLPRRMCPSRTRAHSPFLRNEGGDRVQPSEPRRGEECDDLPPSYRLPTTPPFT